jgi:hypothetical protein
MDSHRFDALTRNLIAAGSRRRMLAAVVAGALGRLAPTPLAEEAAAVCKGYNARCHSHASCCPDVGLRCVKHGKKKKKRCRCKPGWARCPESGEGCLHVAEDEENCGACGHECSANEPCCFGGECQEVCGGACCADCFVFIGGDGLPAPNSDQCCPADKICSSNPKKLSDDRCCASNEECIAGKCCRDGALGAMVCGGKCCSSAACCNGACCPNGKVCASTPNGDACVSANRSCDIDQDCFDDESCFGGVCCSGQRLCGNGQGNNVCCAADEHCELPDSPFAVCCPINTSCNTYTGHRVRR